MYAASTRGISKEGINMVLQLNQYISDLEDSGKYDDEQLNEIKLKFQEVTHNGTDLDTILNQNTNPFMTHV
jgi:hypothetical protein